MPAIVAWIVQALALGAGHIVWRVLLALGIGFATFTGVDGLLSGAETKVFQILGTMGPQALAMYGVLQIGTCVKIIFTALAMRAAIAGISGGSVRKMVHT